MHEIHFMLTLSCKYRDKGVQLPISIHWSNGLLVLPTLTVHSEMLSEIAVDVKRLEVSSICHLQPFLSVRHFINTFKELCVRHFSVCQWRQELVEQCLTFVFINFMCWWMTGFTELSTAQHWLGKKVGKRRPGEESGMRKSAAPCGTQNRNS